MWSRDNLESSPVSTDPNWAEEPMNFFESAKVSYDYQKKALTPNASSALPQAIDERNWEIQQRIMAGEIDPKDWLLPEDQWTANTSATMKGFGNVDFEGIATWLKGKGLPIKTNDDIQQSMRDDIKTALEATQKEGSMAGKFVGAIGAEMTDPMNIGIGIAVSAGAGPLAASNLARFGKLLRTGQLAAEGAVTEALTVPSRMQGAELYGHDYGVKEAAIDITAGAVGMPVLHTLFNFGKKAIQAISGKDAAEGLRANYPGSVEAEKMAAAVELAGDEPVDTFIQKMQDTERAFNDYYPVTSEAPDWLQGGDPLPAYQPPPETPIAAGPFAEDPNMQAAAKQGPDEVTGEYDHVLDDPATYSPEQQSAIDREFEAIKDKYPELQDEAMDEVVKESAAIRRKQEVVETMSACLMEGV